MRSPVLKAKANPQIHQPSAAIEKFVRIFAITVPAFFPRENPISRKAKPACMNITSAPATITHMELMPTDGASSPLIAFSRSVALASAPVGTTSNAANATSASDATACLRLIGYLPPPRPRTGGSAGLASSVSVSGIAPHGRRGEGGGLYPGVESSAAGLVPAVERP